MKLRDVQADTVVCLDFETFFDTKGKFTISALTTEGYIRNPRFQVIGVGVKVNDGPTVWMEEPDFRAWVERVDWDRCALLAHNTAFDGFILSHHYGKHPGFLLDTLSMGRALHGVEVSKKLKDLGPFYGVGEKGDELERADGKRREQFTPEEWEALGSYCRQDVDLCRAIFLKMLEKDFPDAELRLIHKTIRCFTRPIFRLDVPMLEDFLSYERQRKREVLLRVLDYVYQNARWRKDDREETAQEKLAKAVARLEAKWGRPLTEAEHEEATLDLARPILRSNSKLRLLFETLGEEVPMKVSVAKSKTASKKAGEPVVVMSEAFAKDDPGMQGFLESPNDEVRYLAEARVAVMSNINETRTERFIRCGWGGRPAPVFLKYAAAHTFRWGGGDRMNWQNLERVDDPKSPKYNPRKGTIRKAILAPPGWKIIVVDSGQIEARMIAWLAEDQGLLDTFTRNDATGGDFYSDRGSDFFGKKLSKKETPADRQLAKAMILGLGFGMGWQKFAGELLKGMLGTDPRQFTGADAQRYGVDVAKFARTGMKGQKNNGERVEEMPSRLAYDALLIHCAVAHYFVQVYRGRNKAIVDLWDTLGGDVLESMLVEDDTPEFMGPAGCIGVRRHGLQLPNGLVMKYPGLRVNEKGEFSYMGGAVGKERKKLYGGLLTENCVQALARIVVGEQILVADEFIEDRGGQLATMTHDEGVWVAPEEVAGECSEFALGAFAVTPEWAPGLPLKAEGGVADRYGEAK